MSSGPFKWKQAIFGPEFSVSLEAHELRVMRNQITTLIDLRKAKRIYLYIVKVVGISDIVEIFVETEDRSSSKFGVTGLRAARSFEFDECLKATREILEGAKKWAPQCEVVFGLKANRWTRVLTATMILGFMACVGIYSWKDGIFLDGSSDIPTMILFLVLIGLLAAKAAHDFEKVRPLDLAEALDLLD